MANVNSKRPIPGYPGYFATTAGEIISERRGCSVTLKKHPCNYVRQSPYLRVSVSDVQKKQRVVTVHRLVALAFHGAPTAGQQVRHLNGNALDNRADNLRWGTATENWADRKRHGRGMDGFRNVKARLTENEVRGIKARLENGEAQFRLAKEFGVKKATLNHIARGRTWRYVSVEAT